MKDSTKAIIFWIVVGLLVLVTTDWSSFNWDRIGWAVVAFLAWKGAERRFNLLESKIDDLQSGINYITKSIK